MALHRRAVLDAEHAEAIGEEGPLGPCAKTTSKGDQIPKDKAIIFCDREQVLVGVEHGASSALRKEGETGGTPREGGKPRKAGSRKSDLERDNSERREANNPNSKSLVASPWPSLRRVATEPESLPIIRTYVSRPVHPPTL